MSNKDDIDLDSELFGDDNRATAVVDTIIESKTEAVVNINNSHISEQVKDELNKMDGHIPDLRGSGIPDEYVQMVKRIQNQYRLLPKLSYDEIYVELSELSVKSSPVPTLQIINSEIQLIQAAKDRLSEIFIDVYKSFSFKNRAVDILIDSWGKFSSEKSADKRKGDSAYILSNFIMDLATTEGLLKSCQHVLKNLDSAHERLSRTITIWQLTLKINDVGRGALPDFDSDGRGRNFDVSTPVDRSTAPESKIEEF